MNKTDFTSGRIYQRLIDERSRTSTKNVEIVHGLDHQVDINKLCRNLVTLIPTSEITFRVLPHGYEMKVKI